MKLSQFMALVQRNTAGSGEVQAERMVLAVDCSTDGKSEVGDYEIATVHTENLGATLNATSTDKTYLYEGKSTLRSDPQRVFSVTGQRYVGDAFQDFACSHEIKFGTGDAVRRAYVYFNIDSGKGEKGILTIDTKKDGAAAAGNPTDVEISLTSMGVPEAYEYSTE